MIENVFTDDWNRGIPFDFNSMYKGYYARCVFTDFAYVLGAYRLAGIDEKGIPHLFTSYTGKAWDEVSVMMNTPYGMNRYPKSSIIKILGEEQAGQLYLVCEKGEIVILPDCPKCVRIREIDIPINEKVISADLIQSSLQIEKPLENKLIQLRLSNGININVDCGKLRQFRIAISFARQLVLKGATVIDVREEDEHTEEYRIDFAQISRVPLEDMAECLQHIQKDKVMLFICRTGRRADQAAEYARKNGYTKAYSIGGMEEWAHVE